MSIFEERVLKMFIKSENVELMKFYTDRIISHNAGLCNTFPDSGFDLGIPTDLRLYTRTLNNKIPLGVYCAMYTHIQQVDSSDKSVDSSDNKDKAVAILAVPQAYYLYPRSSISKTTLRMSNSLGIIDSGYRGEITAVVDNVDKDSWCSIKLNAMERYFQLCHPSLMPFRVVMVDNIEELGITARGDGGFGSTGK